MKTLKATRENLRVFYKMAIPADRVARAITYATEHPYEVVVDKSILRPTAQEY